ncbi:hypothetical protein GCM10014713_41200 [Streptomyces purpureus]|uniref:Glycosyltransferase 2-like domain-containing protein n=1 Tax=Streptomyces purpureus TaxID=1951 RepID=A0A918H700_9ACTN|nr:hypothetical protein GCM10014713_41200 [Streptomyces purpureus]
MSGWDSYGGNVTVDVVLPCLDEAEALPWVLARIPADWRALVVDNGSTDGSADVARACGATVVHEPRRGFGAACHAGLLAAEADIVCFCDCDASLDPGLLTGFVTAVSEGRADLVLGRRRPQGRGAWPAHARAGNLALAQMLRRRTGLRLHDLGPLRAARRADLLSLGLTDRRSGYPLQMVVRAADAGWRVSEVDVPYLPRTGRSKVTGTWRGTWQAVRDMSRVLAEPAASAPSEPAVPAEATGPASPVEGAGRSESAGPAETAVPATTGGTTAPAGPAEPAASAALSEPSPPGEATGPASPVEGAGRSESAGPAASAVLSEPDAPSKAAVPAKTSETTASTGPAEPAASAAPSEPAVPGEGAGRSEPAAAPGTAVPAKTSETTASTGPAVPAASAASDEPTVHTAPPETAEGAEGAGRSEPAAPPGTAAPGRAATSAAASQAGGSAAPAASEVGP